MRYYLINQEQEKELIELEKPAYKDFYRLSFKDKSLKIYLKEIGEAETFYSTDQKTWHFLPCQHPFAKFCFHSDEYKVLPGFIPQGLGSANTGDLKSQMPGKVIKVEVQEGQEVKQGDTLLILEAMKMENEIKTQVNGIIKAVHVKEGQNLDIDVLMIEIEENS